MAGKGRYFLDKNKIHQQYQYVQPPGMEDDLFRGFVLDDHSKDVNIEKEFKGSKEVVQYDGRLPICKTVEAK